MGIETSKKMLKALGIINLVLGIIFVIIGVLAAGVVIGISSNSSIPNNYSFLVILIVAIGVISIMAGCLDIRAAKDTSKIMPAWIFSIIGLIYSCVNLCLSIAQNAINDPISVLSLLLSIILSVFTFIAANAVLSANKKIIIS